MTTPPMLFDSPVSPSPDSLPFWEAAKDQRLELPFCIECQTFFFYPRTLCPDCGSRRVEWRQASGLGVVHTFCIQYQNSVPGLQGAVPFVTAIVEVEEGPRLMTILVDVEPSPDAVSCGMPVEVAFLDLADGYSLPVFGPRRSE